LPQPSVHVSLSTDHYNFFSTSSIDNVIAIYDLRQAQSISKFTSHVNKRENVKHAFSPCLRYLATGSEDKTARIFDLRKNTELCKLSGHKDVVSGVSFNPLFSQLATCSYDGTVKFFIDPFFNCNNSNENSNFIGI
jgi:WD40 repeat protein